MNQRKVVMISSTAWDLPKHREQVRLACERAGFEPREMMEHLTAENRNAVETSLRMVEEADIYLGILAYRYGTVPTGYDLSITEMEFNRAVELGKPWLVFFIHKDHSVVIEDVETGPGATKLQALKDRIGEARVAAFFKSPEDIRSHVVEALNKLNIYNAAADWLQPVEFAVPPQGSVDEKTAVAARREVLGREPSWRLLQKGIYCPRPDRLREASQELDAWFDECWADTTRMPVFWIDGRSGDGKSVFLLQLAAELLRQVACPCRALLPCPTARYYRALRTDGRARVVRGGRSA